MEKQEITNKLLKLIAKEMENNDLVNQFKNNPEELLNTYFIMCSGEYVNLEIVDLQNKLYKLKENNYVNFDKLKKVNKNKSKYFSMQVECDYTMVFSTGLIENVKSDSLDNYIILNAGILLKQDLVRHFKQDGYRLVFKKAYIIDGYHLPCKKLVKIIYSQKTALESEDVDNMCKAVENGIEHMKEGSALLVDMSTWSQMKEIEKQILHILKQKTKSKKIKLKLIY